MFIGADWYQNFINGFFISISYILIDYIANNLFFDNNYSIKPQKKSILPVSNSTRQTIHLNICATPKTPDILWKTKNLTHSFSWTFIFFTEVGSVFQQKMGYGDASLLPYLGISSPGAVIDRENYQFLGRFGGRIWSYSRASAAVDKIAIFFQKFSVVLTKF